MYFTQAYRQELGASQVLYLDTMLDAYRRCLLSGSEYDLQTVYRLCQVREPHPLIL